MHGILYGWCATIVFVDSAQNFSWFYEACKK